MLELPFVIFQTENILSTTSRHQLIRGTLQGKEPKVKPLHAAFTLDQHERSKVSINYSKAFNIALNIASCINTKVFGSDRAG